MRLAFFLFILFPAIAFCDDDYVRHNLKLNIQIFDEDGSTLNEAHVKIYNESGEEIESKDTDKLGRVYTEELTTWNEYKITFSKYGYVTKTALVRTSYFYYQDRPEHPGLEWKFQVTLFKEEKGKDYSYLSTQPAIIFFFNHMGYQDWNRNYQAKMQLKMELTNLDMDTSMLDSANLFMMDARMWMNYKEIDSAIVNDQRAYDVYPVPFLKKRLDDRIELRETVYDTFYDLKSQADSLFETGKDYSGALDMYERANKTLRNQYEVQDRIYEIEFMIYGYDSPGTKTKVEYMYLMEYRDLMRAGFASKEAGNFKEAIQLYEGASEIFPEQEFPKQMIQECKVLMK
ncbi:MAG: hypothetical protein MK105_19665 [Crocinitomicaceae bacterium]|nr:hypothetical protein [Crocinitomicaceae bacterium]